jgi:uncharacterized protein (DUF58 family)
MRARPTVRGYVAALALGVVVTSAAVTGTPALVPLAVVVGVPLVSAPWLAQRRAQRALETVEIHGHADPATVDVGSAMAIVLSVTNRALGGPASPGLGLPPAQDRWQIRGTRTVESHQHLRLAPPLSKLVALPTPEPGTTQSHRLPVPTGRRGVFELPPSRCWAHDPLSLFGSPGPLTPAVHAVVHPVPVDPGQPIAGLGPARSGEVPDLVRSSGGSGLGDLEGIRPYVVGDRLSLLHWPARARYGAWFVRHFGSDGVAAVPLVLDDRAGVHRKADFERLVSTMMWILQQAMDSGRPVLFLTLSGRSFSLEPNERGRAHAQLILAELQPSSSRSGRVHSAARGSVVLTTRTGAQRLAPWLGHAVDHAGASGTVPVLSSGTVLVV